MNQVNDSAENFRQNLRRLRKHHQQAEDGGWSQADVGDRVGVHRNYIGMLERGERKPALGTVDDLAELLGVEGYELLMPPEEFSG